MKIPGKLADPMMKILRMFLYLVLIVLIGGVGCWISLGQHWVNPSATSFDGFLGNLGTFAVSVAVMAFADFLLLPASVYNSTKALCLYVLMALAVGSGILVVVWHPEWIWWLGTASLGLAVFEWIVVNLGNQNFDEPGSILGGDVE